MHEHLKEVADELDRFVRLHKPQVVVIASEEAWAELDGLLSQEVRRVLAGVAQAEAHAQPPELLAAATPVLERWRAGRETDLVDRWKEELGRKAVPGMGRDARGRL